MPKRTICLDFDGVLHSYVSGWKGIEPTDPPTHGAQEFVQDLLNMGYIVVIQSTRADTREGEFAIMSWLQKHKFPVKELQQQENNDQDWISATKPKALLYVDDRGIRFTGKFDDVIGWIQMNPGFEPWYRDK